MTPPSHLGAHVRRFVHFACTLALASVLLAPMLLGPAAAWVITELGGAAEHHCACGMAAGKCGCPECALLEKDRADARRAEPVPVLRTRCNDEPPVAATVALPLAAPLAALLPSPLPGRAEPASPPPRAPPGRGRDEPTKPPPRAEIAVLA